MFDEQWESIKATLIAQRRDNDCSVATVAMYLHISYKEALRAALSCMTRNEAQSFQDGYRGVPVHTQLQIAHDHGMKVVGVQIDQFDRNKSAMLVVPSLNGEGTHSVYYDGTYVLDPNLFKSGKQWYDPNTPLSSNFYSLITYALQLP